MKLIKDGKQGLEDNNPQTVRRLLVAQGDVFVVVIAQYFNFVNGILPTLRT
jgi:hypothetical protein